MRRHGLGRGRANVPLAPCLPLRPPPKSCLHSAMEATKGSSMRKIGFILAVVAAAAMPSIAEAAKKGKKSKAQPAAQPTQTVDPNEASGRLVRGAIPIFLPTGALPLYLATPMGQQDHPNQNPSIFNPQGSQPQQPATKSKRAKQSKRQ